MPTERVYDRTELHQILRNRHITLVTDDSLTLHLEHGWVRIDLIKLFVSKQSASNAFNRSLTLLMFEKHRACAAWTHLR